MMEIYHRLFKALSAAKISFFLYKSIEQLPLDLAGARGDLDILVSPAQLPEFVRIAKSIGFATGSPKGSLPVYLVARDDVTGRLAMLDLDCQLRAGRKPRRGIRVSLPWHRLPPDFVDSPVGKLPTLSPADRIVAALIMRLTARNPKQEDLDEVKGLIGAVSPADLMGSTILRTAASHIDVDALRSDIVMAGSWSELRVSWERIFQRALVPCWLERALNGLLDRFDPIDFLRRLMRRLTGTPLMRLGRGIEVAILGIDGSGKSTLISNILNDHFLRLTGIKSIYLGHNHYMIPGLSAPSALLMSTWAGRVLIELLARCDRQLRYLKGLWLVWSGNVVVFDRHFHDDIIAADQAPPPTGFVRRCLRQVSNMLTPKMVTTPDLVIFLDIDGAAAFGRKTDLPLEVKIASSQAYRAGLRKFPDVVTIDASQSRDRVFADAMKALLEARYNVLRLKED